MDLINAFDIGFSLRQRTVFKKASELASAPNVETLVVVLIDNDYYVFQSKPEIWTKITSQLVCLNRFEVVECMLNYYKAPIRMLFNSDDLPSIEAAYSLKKRKAKKQITPRNKRMSFLFEKATGIDLTPLRSSYPVVGGSTPESTVGGFTTPSPEELKEYTEPQLLFDESENLFGCGGLDIFDFLEESCT